MRIAITALAASLAVASPAVASADEAPEARDGAGVFSLGQIVVTARRPEGIAIGGETLGSEAIYAFNRNTLDDAASLIPGVTAGNSGGSRNERLLFVRGFDRFQVPLSVDGIRVYLPADNRLDYGRFLTPDIAELQVAKGYASVLDGPGAMGGAVNLVTRKPTKALEIEARGTLNLDRDIDYAGYNVFGLVGTRQDRWYAQASYTRNFQDHWDLPGGYGPAAGSAEDGGERDFSRTRDWRVNAKLGFTPNATDEYSLSYTRQEGAKNAPLHVSDPVATPLPSGAPNPRYWTWPYWNIESIYFLSTTALGDRATLKTRVYRNKFDNLLRSFNDRTQTTQTLARAFDSYYEDEAWGGSAELGVRLTEADKLTIAAHYRRDEHRERQDGFYNRVPTNAGPPIAYSEPWQATIESTYSIAAENVLAIDPTLSLTLGASFDWRDLKKAEEYTVSFTSPPNFFEYPKADAEAFNWQGRLDWRPADATSLHASISRRARFPTIFERFSTQFGNAASNPGLDPERATNYEIGGTHKLGALSIEGALFYSRINDAIVSVRLVSLDGVPAPANTTRRENLGKAEYYGGEIGLSLALGETLSAGINYTYTHRDFAIVGTPPNEIAPDFRLTDVPTHKGFAYASWSPVPALQIVPSVEFASNRTTLNTYVTAGETAYYRTGSYVQGNLRVDFDVTDQVSIGLGGRNLFDDGYTLTDGFPEPGRSFFASLRFRN